MYRRTRHALVALVVLVLAASLVPAVSAKGIRPAASTTCHQYCNEVSRGGHRPVIVRTEIVSAHRGFSWADAAIGFGVASGLMLAAAGVLVSRSPRRSRRREVEAAV